ncbi:hypothetical protein ACO0LG_12035 [Undibacterium sp. Ji42W]|uniref:hypothetical protein n=1 Tax=Undibacterium sp. Ji42W TaxID=3413039 RepID=UPI003BF35347
MGNRNQKTETTASGTTTTTYTYYANDRLTQETKVAGATSTVTACTWDNRGNLSTKTAGGQVTVYSWNADNSLVEVKQVSSQTTVITVARYSYDVNGNRVQKSEPGQNTSPDKITNYLVDDTFDYAQTVQESTIQGGATESTSYVWGNGLIRQSRAGQLSYYHADALGSVKVLIVVGNNRLVLVQPGWTYSSGMTLREEGGFLIGKFAGSSQEELIKTFLHEIYRLEFEAAIEAGAAGVSTAATEAAFGFAERAYALFRNL